MLIAFLFGGHEVAIPEGFRKKYSLDGAKYAKDDVDAALEFMFAALARLDADRKNITAAAAEAQAELAAKVTELDRSECERLRLDGELSGAEKQCYELSSLYAASQGEIVELEAKIDELKTEIGSLSTRNDDLRRELTIAKKELERAAAEQPRRIERLCERSDALLTALEEYEPCGADAEQLSRLEKKLDRIINIVSEERVLTTPAEKAQRDEDETLDEEVAMSDEEIKARLEQLFSSKAEDASDDE